MGKTAAMCLIFAVAVCSCGGGTLGGTSPSVVLSPASLTFGTELVGSTSQPLTITLTNSGSGMLDITSITASPDFGETNTCNLNLSAGANCAISVTFTPAASGTATGTISVADNASGSPQTILLSGDGTSIGPSCSVKGQQCGAPQLPRCCPGLTCVPATTRAFCEPSSQ